MLHAYVKFFQKILFSQKPLLFIPFRMADSHKKKGSNASRRHIARTLRIRNRGQRTPRDLIRSQHTAAVSLHLLGDEHLHHVDVGLHEGVIHAHRVAQPLVRLLQRLVKLTVDGPQVTADLTFNILTDLYHRFRLYWALPNRAFHSPQRPAP